MFGGGDDDEAGGAVPKRKLVKLDDEDVSKDETDEAEDKKRIIKSLIERIPTAKDELFAYSLDWTIVDQVSFVLQCCKLLFHFRTKQGRESFTEHHVSVKN